MVASTTVCRWWYVAGWCSDSSAGGKRGWEAKQKAMVGRAANVSEEKEKAAAGANGAGSASAASAAAEAAPEGASTTTATAYSMHTIAMPEVTCSESIERSMESGASTLATLLPCYPATLLPAASPSSGAWRAARARGR